MLRGTWQSSDCFQRSRQRNPSQDRSLRRIPAGRRDRLCAYARRREVPRRDVNFQGPGLTECVHC
ncbi:hypothetical protein [Lysobacter gummosus]|uniref:hypothetical protein n=1 Tax=Lysobacter gummosus TaxID=262324 RepID=UPI00364558CB